MKQNKASISIWYKGRGGKNDEEVSHNMINVLKSFHHNFSAHTIGEKDPADALLGS